MRLLPELQQAGAKRLGVDREPDNSVLGMGCEADRKCAQNECG
jgi:hypothetical protein